MSDKFPWEPSLSLCQVNRFTDIKTLFLYLEKFGGGRVFLDGFDSLDAVLFCRITLARADDLVICRSQMKIPLLVLAGFPYLEFLHILLLLEFTNHGIH